MLFVTVTVSGKLQALRFQCFLRLFGSSCGRAARGHLQPPACTAQPFTVRVSSKHNRRFFFWSFVIIILRVFQAWEEMVVWFLFYYVMSVIHAHFCPSVWGWAQTPTGTICCRWAQGGEAAVLSTPCCHWLPITIRALLEPSTSSSQIQKSFP